MTEAQRGHAAMLCFSALVAGTFSLGSMSVPFIDPAVLNAVRFVIAATLMLAAAVVSKQMSRQAWSAPWRYFVLAGLFAIYFVTMFEGLKTAAPASMAAVFTLSPALTAVFGFWLVSQVTTLRMAIAIVIGGVGALWVIFQGDLNAALRFDIGRGEAIYFWGCIAHALYSPLLRKLNRGEPALAFIAGVLTAGAIILCLWAGRGLIETDWASLPGIVWITIIYSSVVATGLTFLILRYATLRLPSAKVMAYTYLVPSWVILWELALGRAVPSTLVLPGVALTALALLVLLKDEEPQVVSG